MKISFPWAFLLGSVLVILKALGNIDLAWIWVLAPFWVPLAIVIAPGLLLVLFYLAAYIVIGAIGLVALLAAHVLEWVESLGRKFRRRSHSSQKYSRYNR